jgi:serralysin
MATEELDWICTTLDTDKGERLAASPTLPLPMGLAAKKTLWPAGTQLKVRFLGGAAELHERVLAAARAWFQPGVNLSLGVAQLGDDPQVRIAFAKGGSWSYIGTDCLAIHPSQATMNLGWLDLGTSDDALRSVVLHEWGHALGLLHEHNHPEAQISWNKASVYADLESAPNYWSKDKVDLNVFRKYAVSEVITTDFDDVSVMIYPIRSAWTTDAKKFMPSAKLSSGDVATIKRLYPAKVRDSVG